ncbi:EamA family transporter [Dactylosporangium matsuzakiense]|uniref:Membrane protein n=1 Tax=Dactylosporangium matsuzakiense TaxID=53360 RepID=A0A9W6KKQ7_9ACTN|nr:EamA family transporter [Dactylosporangium matsuzakiense]UWZ41613.1 EamA family transporter [Dactylosporangium matsuzakiense]GLL02314.1 membrane protein [Dactylosporangium matsuzakiense]
MADPVAGLSAGVIALTLTAAVLHAAWNALAHGVRDRLIGFALIGLGCTGAGAAGVLVLGSPPAAAWPLLLASAAMHVVYVLLLWASYELGDFSQAYPIARGSAPWLVAVIEVVLGRRLPIVQAAGIVVITAGLLSLAAVGRERRNRAVIGAALATGVAIAGYTVIDAAAVAVTPVPVYAAWLFLLQGPVLPVVAFVRRRRKVVEQARGLWAAGIGGGLVSVAAYGLVLVAQTSGATAAIAALRETSIVIGALIGAAFLGEALGRRRAVAAAVVTVGIVLLSL